ncbi:MAG: ABC transporter permease [Trueperaceae bacterium]
MTDVGAPTAEVEPTPRRLGRSLGRLGRSSSFWLGGAIVALLVAIALVGPLMVPGDPYAMSVRSRLQPPSAEHLLGTDEFGRDVLTRLVHGSRLTLQIGVVSVGIALVVGGLLGVLSGFIGGWFDVLAMGLVDVLLAFPAILLALAIIAVLGPGLTNTMIAVGISSIPGFARVVRSATLEVKQRVFVEAARALGGSAARVMFHHVGRNIVSPLLVLITLQFPVALLSSAALGFIGLGAQPPEPEWGAMLVSARDYLRRAPWLVNAPGLAIVFTVLGFNLLGNALRDALDPAQRGA